MRPLRIGLSRAILARQISSQSPVEGFGIDSRLCDCPKWGNKYQGGALDLPVNVALLAVASLVVLRSGLDVNRPVKPFTPFDQHVNIAIRHETPRLPPSPIEPTLWKPRLQVDVFPNLATASIVQPLTRTPIYVTAPPKPWAKFDQHSNVAVNFQTIRPAGTYIDPPRWKPTPLPPDVYPNIAVKFQTVMTWPNAEVTLWKTKAQQPDIYPNLAIEQIAQFTQWIDPVLWKVRFQAPDIYPNLAIEPIPFVPSQWVEPVLWRGRFQVENYPNVAVNFPAPFIPPGGIPVPDFTGIHWYKASFLLVQAGFVQTQTPVKVDIKNRAPPGYVISQYPPAGSYAIPGTNIVLTVITEYLDNPAFGIYPWYDPSKLQ